jgi:hypothetical protein
MAACDLPQELISGVEDSFHDLGLETSATIRIPSARGSVQRAGASDAGTPPALNGGHGRGEFQTWRSGREAVLELVLLFCFLLLFGAQRERTQRYSKSQRQPAERVTNQVVHSHSGPVGTFASSSA